MRKLSFNDPLLNVLVHLIEELNDIRTDVPDDFMDRIETAYKNITDMLFNILAQDQRKGKKILKQVREALLMLRVSYTDTLVRFDENRRSWYVYDDFYPDDLRNALAVG